MKPLLLLALGMALLLTLAAAPSAAAYDGHPTASATMSCSDNTATMTKTVVVTVTWKKVGVAQLDAQAWTPSPLYLLASGTINVPQAQSGTASLTFTFSDTAQFGTMQWQLYSGGYGGYIAPVEAGQFDAASFPGC